MELGEKTGTVTKSGAWYSYGEIRLGQGFENSRRFLQENPDIALKIDSQIREVAEGKVLQGSEGNSNENEDEAF